MAGVNSAYLNAIAAANPITHIGLVDETGTELTGGSPAYARLPTDWTAASDGDVLLDANLTFDVPAVTVGGWRGFSALTGGTAYGGKDLTNEVFAAQGEYTLLAASTGINHNAAA